MSNDKELVNKVKETFATSATKGKNVFLKALAEYGANFSFINEPPMKTWFWKDFAEQNDIDLSKEKEKKSLSLEETERLETLAKQAASKSIGSRLDSEVKILNDTKANYIQTLAELNITTSEIEKERLKENLEKYTAELFELYSKDQNILETELKSLLPQVDIKQKQLEKAMKEADKEREEELEKQRRAAEREAKKKKK